jgi:hypothetical protein
MKKILFLTILPVFFLQFMVFSAVITPAQAADPLDISNQQGFESGGPIQTAFGESDQPADPRDIIVNIIKIVLEFLGIIFVVLLIFGGFKYMTAAGNESQVDEAKKLIVQAVIGLAIILSAYAITVFVSRSLINAVAGTSSFFPQ